MRRFAQTILLILALCLGAPFVAIARSASLYRFETPSEEVSTT